MSIDEKDFTDRRFLVETDWLEAHLDDEDLRIFDCTTKLIPDPELDYRVEGDAAGWATGRIPGAGYVNVQDDLSVTPHRHRFMLPGPEDFAARAGALGIGDDTRVVLYSRTQPFWSTRAWWTLHAMGFDNAAVLNGGFQKWAAEGRPVAKPSNPDAVHPYPPATFAARPRREVVCDKDDVLSALDDPGVAVVNALSEEQHRGTGGMSFGRAGRIARSVNVPHARIWDMQAGTIGEPATLRRLFAQAGATPDKRIVNYCGGGLSATLVFFAQKLLGYPDVALYDASMQEWASEPDLPMEKD